jgi:hypothetical protein
VWWLWLADGVGRRRRSPSCGEFPPQEKRNVGLITVDTYRIAAVEQLRTYAEIIDLPMAVVSTPREMREAVTRMSDLELILMDTAGNCTLVDKGSTNGTFINGVRVTETRLDDGMSIRCGSTELRYLTRH